MDEPIESAHERISRAFRELGYGLDDVPGVIDGVTVHDHQGRYVFSWHTNPHHLLFYIRKPALEAKSTLRQLAIAQHPSDRVNRNPSGETTITLTSDEEAQTLLDWLMPKLPLP